MIAEGVADIFALAGLEKPDIGLLSDEFLEDIRHLPAKNLAVELLEKLLRDEIRAKTTRRLEDVDGNYVVRTSTFGILLPSYPLIPDVKGINPPNCDMR